MITIDIFQNSLIKNKAYNEPVSIIFNSELLSNRAFSQRPSRPTITFENCSFRSDVSISNTDEISEIINISFMGCEISSLNCSYIESKNVSISLYRCSVLNFVVNDGNLDLIQTNNCLGVYFISNINRINITYTEDNIRVREWFKKSKKNELIKEKISFHLKDIKNITFNTDEISNDKIKKLTKEKNIKIEGKNKGIYIEDYYLRDKQIKHLYYSLSKKEKESLDISLSINYSTNFEHLDTRVTGGYLKSLTLIGKPLGNIVIEEVKVNNIFIHEFSPQGDFKLMTIRPISLEKDIEAKFEVHKSILDNTWFYGIEFIDYKEISFYKSSFINTKITSSSFPSAKKMEKQIQSVKNIHYPNEKTLTFQREQYELFLELKQAFEKRGNFFESQKMKSIALNYLQRVKGISPINDRFVLWLNKTTNKHGISPVRALIATISVVILFHTLNILSFETIYFNIKSDNTFDIIKNNFKYIFSIANPTHKISSLAPESEITSYTYAVSFCSRLFIGYMLYQFIASFRRFGKG